MAQYRCRKCGKIVRRNSTAATIKSYCDATGNDVRLVRVRPYRQRCKQCRKAIRGAPFKSEFGNFCHWSCADDYIPF